MARGVAFRLLECLYRMLSLQTVQLDSLYLPACLGDADEMFLCRREMLEAYCGDLWPVEEMRKLKATPVKQVHY